MLEVERSRVRAGEGGGEGRGGVGKEGGMGGRRGGAWREEVERMRRGKRRRGILRSSTGDELGDAQHFAGDEVER